MISNQNPTGQEVVGVCRRVDDIVAKSVLGKMSCKKLTRHKSNPPKAIYQQEKDTRMPLLRLNGQKFSFSFLRMWSWIPSSVGTKRRIEGYEDLHILLRLKEIGPTEDGFWFSFIVWWPPLGC